MSVNFQQRKPRNPMNRYLCHWVRVSCRAPGCRCPGLSVSNAIRCHASADCSHHVNQDLVSQCHADERRSRVSECANQNCGREGQPPALGSCHAGRGRGPCRDLRHHQTSRMSVTSQNTDTSDNVRRHIRTRSGSLIFRASRLRFLQQCIASNSGAHDRTYRQRWRCWRAARRAV